MKVLADLVLIKPIIEEVKGGLERPESSKKLSSEGVVLEVGPLVDDVKVGDHVIYRKWVGDIVEDGKEELVFMRVEDVLAIVEKETNDVKTA